MRKTSQDGGDSTSITSGFENELRKASVGIMKTKRNSLKKKVQNFSHESDDTVIEPLLQIDKNETANRSAKYLLSKSKTDSLSERDNNVIYSDNNVEKSCVTKYVGTTAAITTSTNASRTLHNHMNTNVFGGHDISKAVTTVKSPVLVEISGSRPAVRSNQTSSIFTTAKIHADNITKNMEPIQVTPVPILSTVEGSVVKAGISPDYASNKNIVPSTSISILKPIGSQDKDLISTTQPYGSSHLARSEVGKTDPYRTTTEHIVKKLNDVLDNQSSILKTESELKLLNISTDTKKENVIASTVAKSIDSEIVSKSTLQLKPSICTTSDKKVKPIQENRNDGFKDNLKSLQKIPDVKNVEVAGRITSQYQNVSNLKSAIVKDDVKKKEDKNVSGTSSGSKQLQRQKNAICESDKLDDIINNESLKFSKDIISTTSTSSTSGAIMPTSKSKDNLIHSGVSHKSDTETGKKSLVTSTEDRNPIKDNVSPSTTITSQGMKKTDPVQSIHSIPTLKTDLREAKTSPNSSIISKPTDENSLITTTTPKSDPSKSIDTFKSKPSTTSLRPDLAIEKKVMTPSEISKPSTSMMQSDSTLKEKSIVKPTEIYKPVTENISTTKGLSQKSTTAVTMTQVTTPIKPDSKKETKTVVGSNQTSKSAVEDSLRNIGISKGVTQKPNTAATKSINNNQSVSVKDGKTTTSSVPVSKTLKDKSLKESLISKPSTTSAEKSSITADTKGLAKTNTAQNLKKVTTPKDISQPSASTDLNNTMAAVSHKTDKAQNKTITEDKSKIPITIVPTSTIPLTKTEVKSQSTTAVTSSGKSLNTSKMEPTNVSGVISSSTVSSVATTTNTSTTTIAKSTSEKITSKTNVLDKHGKI